MLTLSCKRYTGPSEAYPSGYVFDVQVEPSRIYNGAVNVDELTSEVRQKFQSDLSADSVLMTRVLPRHCLEVVDQVAWERWTSNQLAGGFSGDLSSNMVLDSSTKTFMRLFPEYEHASKLALATNFELKVKLMNRHEPGRIEIFVRTLAGKTLTIHTKSSDNVKYVKDLLEWFGDLAPHQELIFGTQQLEDSRTLSSYKIQQGSWIVLSSVPGGELHGPYNRHGLSPPGMFHLTSGRAGNYNPLSEPSNCVVSLTVVASPSEWIEQLRGNGEKPELKKVELKSTDSMQDFIHRVLFLEGDEKASAHESADTTLARAGVLASIMKSSIGSTGDSGECDNIAGAAPSESDVGSEIGTEVVWSEKQMKAMLAVELEMVRRATGKDRKRLSIRSGIQAQVLKQFELAVNAANLARLRRAAVQYPEFGLSVQMLDL